jgi:hypothetical protein
MGMLALILSIVMSAGGNSIPINLGDQGDTVTAERCTACHGPDSPKY